MQIKNKKKQRWYKAAGKAKTLILLHCALAKYKKCKNTKIGKIQKLAKYKKLENTNIENTHAI